MFITKAERILELHAEKLTVKEIMRRAKATERYVRKIINGEYQPSNRPTTATPDPTPEEIEAGCAAARAKWTAFQLDERNCYRPEPVEPPVLPMPDFSRKSL